VSWGFNMSVGTPAPRVYVEQYAPPPPVYVQPPPVYVQPYYAPPPPPPVYVYKPRPYHHKYWKGYHGEYHRW